MKKNELKDLIKECIMEMSEFHEAATSENFVTFKISGGYHDYKNKPVDSEITLTVSSALDIFNSIKSETNSEVRRLSTELAKHLPMNRL